MFQLPPYDRIGRTIIDEMAAGRLDLPFWLVYDDRRGEVPPVKATNVSMVETEHYRAAGLWRTAGTLDGLAEIIGVPAAAPEFARRDDGDDGDGPDAAG